ncbi:MAG TPA: ATP-dependent zinc metalloprotease FtsH [Candidatus Dormibacteraeota bacterium]|nr:ATP-dependent zinc metalloprotease FtsH [Candidatus Dormibacteraeota bacterium]
MTGQTRRNLLFLSVGLVAIALLGAFGWQSIAGTQTQTWTYSHLLDQAERGEVSQLQIQGPVGHVTTFDGRHYDVQLPDQTSRLAATMTAERVDVSYQVDDAGTSLLRLVPFLLLVPLIGILVYFVMQQTRGQGNQQLTFTRSRARMVVGGTPRVTFVDVAGADEAKQELTEVVEFLKDPLRFTELGARIPRGVLLVGPPGTGKTLLSKAVAGEAGVPFFSVSGSEFVEMFVGVGASRVRDLFEQAKRHSPCIVFVDEIDAVGRQRRLGFGGAHDEREQTLNQLLVEMDGFDTNTHVIVIAATNRADVLDPALLRPGRFDRHVTLDRPDVRGRRQILDVHARNKPLDTTVDLDVLARQTPGFSGADLANLINEAAILTGRGNRKVIGMDDLEEAIARIVAGPERRSRRISDKEKEVIAYHEVGHALVMKAMPLCDPVHKVSIISRGTALGLTLSLPAEDRYLAGREELKQRIAGIMGGRLAEEIVFGDVTSGAEDDIRRATDVARRMVTRWGMSERLGTVMIGSPAESDQGGRPGCSEELAAQVDAEVGAVVREATDRARQVLEQSRARMDAVVATLLDVETMRSADLDALLAEVDASSEQPAAG